MFSCSLLKSKMAQLSSDYFIVSFTANCYSGKFCMHPIIRKDVKIAAFYSYFLSVTTAQESRRQLITETVRTRIRTEQ